MADSKLGITLSRHIYEAQKEHPEAARLMATTMTMKFFIRFSRYAVSAYTNCSTSPMPLRSTTGSDPLRSTMLDGSAATGPPSITMSTRPLNRL